MNLAPFTVKLLRWLGLAAAFGLLSGCFLTSALPQDKKSKPGHSTTPEVPPAAVPPVKPSNLSPQRLARRLAIELFGLSEADARASIDRVVNDKQRVTLARHVAIEQYRMFRDRLPTALIEPVSNDARIYPVTPETLEQLDEIVKTR